VFDERRAAQAASYLLFRSGGSMPLIKLIKLIYLSERLSLQRYGEPLTGDKLVSMDHGPVLSRVYDHLNGSVRSSPGGWDSWISDRAGHIVALRDPEAVKDPDEDLLALSESDLEVLAEVWQQFGHWDRWDLVRYTHENLPEWQNPNGSSLPISYASLFNALGYSERAAAELQAHLAEQDRLSAVFAA